LPVVRSVVGTIDIAADDPPSSARIVRCATSSPRHPAAGQMEGMAMASELETLRARVGALEDICGAAYQLAGTVGAPIRFLDALAAAAGGKRIPKVDLLPVSEMECDQVREREDLITRARELLGASAAV
jgi:hypothetical protein